MRQKLALIIALAGFAVVTAFGVGMAGADPWAGLSEGQATQGLSTTPSLVTPPNEKPACSNGVDDDEDGLIDLEDPDCESAEDTSEEAEEAANGEGKPATPAEGEEAEQPRQAGGDRVRGGGP